MSKEQEMKNEVISKDMMTVPNAMSFLRIVLITPFVAFFIERMYIAAAVTVAVSGLTDLLDGFIARKFHQESELGKVLDPLADKLTLIAVGVCLIFIDPYVLPLMIIMVTKDFLMIIGGTIIIKQGVIPPKSAWYGKLSTFMFYISVCTIVVMAVLGYQNETLSIILLSITAALMIFSLICYFIQFIQIEKDLKTKEKSPSVQVSITDKD